MLQVGISGSIGSGKTTVCQLFELLGVPIYYADAESKKIMVQDIEVKQKLVSAFGENIFDSQGALERKKLASIVFNDIKKLDVLNSIVHPAVEKDSHKWLSNQDAT